MVPAVNCYSLTLIPSAITPKLGMFTKICCRTVNTLTQAIFASGYFLKSATNKVNGRMKGEFLDTTVEEFVSLRAKMYSALADHGIIKRAKGLMKAVVKKNILIRTILVLYVATCLV